MRNYYRIMAGAKSVYAAECRSGDFIGVDWFSDIDLSGQFPDNWRDFNAKYVPVYLKEHPDKTKIAAGLASGMTWTVCKGIREGDIVLMPDSQGCYHVGDVQGEYFFAKGQVLPHRRRIVWYPNTIQRSDMSEDLRKSTGSIGTSSFISKFHAEIDALITGDVSPVISSTDESVENASEFVMEKYLEQFLVDNWTSTELGKKYDIYSEDGELKGQQFSTETGKIDILAISKDKKEVLVVELKKGRASDAVVGQVQRYMGDIMEQYLEKDQKVRGVIIALSDDLRLQRALLATTNIEFYRYKISFQLIKA
jgi:restriction system protein